MDNNTIVRRIVEMDKEARRLTEEARRRRAGTASAAGRKRQEVSDNYLSMARKRIDDIRGSEMSDAQEQWERMEKQLEQTARGLEELYERKAEEWVDSIVERALSGDE